MKNYIYCELFIVNSFLQYCCCLVSLLRDLFAKPNDLAKCFAENCRKLLCNLENVYFKFVLLCTVLLSLLIFFIFRCSVPFNVETKKINKEIFVCNRARCCWSGYVLQCSPFIVVINHASLIIQNKINILILTIEKAHGASCWWMYVVIESITELHRKRVRCGT